MGNDKLKVRTPEVYSKMFLELSELKRDWDSYGASPVSTNAIMYAMIFGLKCNLFLKPNLSIVPCSDGCVQLELHQAGYDLEWTIDDDGDIFGFYQYMGQEICEKIHISDKIPKLWSER